MVNRQKGIKNVVLGNNHVALGNKGIANKILVAKHNPLGLTGSSTGKKNGCGIFKLWHLNLRLFVRSKIVGILILELGA